MSGNNNDGGNDPAEGGNDHHMEQIISDNVRKTAGSLHDTDFQQSSSYNDVPAGPPRDYYKENDDDDDDDRSSYAVEVEEDEEMDLMSLAAGSVVSMTETVVTGIKTSLSHWKIILFGQILALLMGLRGASTAFLYLECNIMAPTFQLWWIYLLLSFNLLIHIASAGSDPANRRGRNNTGGIVFDLSILHDRPKMSSQRKTYFLPCCGDLVKLHTPWWNYLFLSLLDLEGNYFTYLALKYTSLKSASLLDTLSIPTAMLASYMCLRKVYSGAHLVGAFICLAGALVMVFADYTEEQGELSSNAVSNSSNNNMGDAYGGMTLEEVVYAEEHNNQGDVEPYQDETDMANSNSNTFPDYYNNIGGGLGGNYYNYNNIQNESNDATSSVFNSRTVQGDILAAVGGMCWGLKDTLSEGALQRSSRTEFLGMIGFFGFLIASVQTAALESVVVKDFFSGFTNAPYDTCSSKETYGVFFAMIFIFVLYYLGNARFLNMSEAALLQLSLLASDLYAVLFSVIEEHKLPTWMFVVSMILILLGVLVYESVPAPFTRDARTFGAYMQSPTRERKRYQSRTDDDEMYYDDTKYNINGHNGSRSTGNDEYRYDLSHNDLNKVNGIGNGGGSPDTMLSEEDRRHLTVLGIDDEEELSFEQSLAEIELSNPYVSPPRDHPPTTSTAPVSPSINTRQTNTKKINGTSAPSEFEII